MKTRSTSVLILGAALSVSAFIPLSGASKSSLPVAYPVRTVTVTSEGGEQVEYGMSRADVAWAFSSRARLKLAPEVWAYVGYQADLDKANEQDCRILVITFVHDKVANIQLVNHSAAAIIAANLKHGVPVTYVASND